MPIKLTKHTSSEYLLELNSRLEKLIESGKTIDPRGFKTIVTGFKADGSAIVKNKPLRISVKEQATSTSIRFLSGSSLSMLNDDVNDLEKRLLYLYPNTQ